VCLVSREDRLDPSKDISSTKTETNTCTLILSTHYCKELSEIRKFLNEKQQLIDHIIGETTDIIIANRRHANISDQLFKRRRLATTPVVPSTVIKTFQVHSAQVCNRARCMTCELMVDTDNGCMVVNGQKCRIDMGLNCSDTNLIYVAQCRSCVSGFYFGQTWNTLSSRMNGHRAGFKDGQQGKSALAMHIFEAHTDKFSDKLLNFKIGIILTCNREDLNMFEDNYIEKFKARIIGLNRCRVNGN